MTGTQAALYAEIDLELSWSESALPQSARTKHVHGLHPYLGKFPPQLAEALIDRHCPAGGLVLDPFCGSGTTLVAAAKLGRRFAACDAGELAIATTSRRLEGEGIAFERCEGTLTA